MRHLQGNLLAALLAALSWAVSGTAHAQEVAEVSPTGKGIVGGALLGGEVVMLVEAAFDTKPGWAYAVGGIAGAAGGGVGGYFIEKGGDAKLSLYMLAGGMALVIPTAVAVLSATAYEPPAGYTEDRPSPDEPVAEPPSPSPALPPAGATGPQGSRDAGRAGAREAAGSAGRFPIARPARLVLSQPRLGRRVNLGRHAGLVGLTRGKVSLAVPAVEIRGVYSKAEVSIFHVRQKTEVRVPVMSIIF